MEEQNNFEGELIFNNVDYLVSMRQIQQSTFDPMNQRLYLEVEEKMTGNLWKGDFQAKYIEDITAKTGVAKKFNVFIKMMLQALRSNNTAQGDGSVCIDLLTFSDLEALKNKRPGAPSQQNQASTNAANNTKRYMILTYITEYERVHYPLSLNFVEEPETDQLRRTIERMRNLILMQRSNTFTSGGSSYFGQNSTSKNFANTSSQAQQQQYNKIDDFAAIEVENDQLRRQINEMEVQFSQSHQEFFNLSQQKFYTEDEYDKYKRTAQKEILSLQDQVRTAEQELAQLQEQLKTQQSQNPSNRNTQTSGFSLSSGGQAMIQGSQLSDLDHVKRQLEDITSQLGQERSTTGSTLEKQEKEIEDCKKELEEQKESERKLKQRQKDLQDELDHTLKRIEQLQRGISTPIRRKNPLYGSGSGANSGSGSRNASPYNRNNSGNKKQGTPTSSGYGKVTNLYGRNNSGNRAGSDGRVGGNVNGVQRQSPTSQNRFGSNKPPSSIRQNSNTRQSPTTYNRAPVTGQPRQPTYLQRNSSNNRSGSNNNRTGAVASNSNLRGTNYSNGSAINNQNKAMVGGTRSTANQRVTGQSNNGVYDRLYGNKNQSTTVNNRSVVNNQTVGANVGGQASKNQVIDYQVPERDLNQNNSSSATESLNINIAVKNGNQNVENKENNSSSSLVGSGGYNQQQMIQSQVTASNAYQNKYGNAYEPVVANRQDGSSSANGNGTNYDDVDVKDINSKLSRLQDLLQKAKQQ